MRVWPFDGRTNKKNAYVQSFMFSTLPPIRTQLAKKTTWARWLNIPVNTYTKKALRIDVPKFIISLGLNAAMLCFLSRHGWL